ARRDQRAADAARRAPLRVVPDPAAGRSRGGRRRRRLARGRGDAAARGAERPGTPGRGLRRAPPPHRAAPRRPGPTLARGAGAAYTRGVPASQNPLFYQTRAELPTVSHGEGVWLVDTEGRRYLDGCSGAVVANVGHGHPHVLRAMREQAERVTFAYRTQFENEPAVRLAQGLVEHLGGELSRVFLVSGGSEATETAIKLARAYHRARGEGSRYRILSRFPSYHGSTLGALAASGYV